MGRGQRQFAELLWLAKNLHGHDPGIPALDVRQSVLVERVLSNLADADPSNLTRVHGSDLGL
ncbi:MAG: hypothetical protein ACK6DC_12050, partial [Planctomycetota bacterium]